MLRANRHLLYNTRNVIVATNNEGKLKEVKEILGPRGYRVHSLDDLGIHIDPEETGSTYEENAIIKAKAIYDEIMNNTIPNKDRYIFNVSGGLKVLGSHLLILSDDSGIELEALNGRPGIFTHREIKGDPKNLLSMLTPDMIRVAKFVCSACLIACDLEADRKLTSVNKIPMTAFGTLTGIIANENRGNDDFQIYSTFIPLTLDNGTTIENDKTLGELLRPSSFNHRYSAIAKLFNLPSADHI